MPILGGSGSDNGAMSTREVGLSPTNGKKWFPKGYKATTQNRCAEKQTRKWFCENYSLDPVHPKQTTLPVLTDMTVGLFPNHNKKQIYPKLEAQPPSSTNALKSVELCCVCLNSLPHTQSFSHNWPLPQLPPETGSALYSVRSTPTVQGLGLCAAAKLLSRATPLLVHLVVPQWSRYLRAEPASQTDKDPGAHGWREGLSSQIYSTRPKISPAQQTEGSHYGGTC